MMSEGPATETSPLLGPSNGNTSTGAIINNAGPGGHRQPDEEQAKEPSANAQMQLKYIVPAISIGV